MTADQLYDKITYIYYQCSSLIKESLDFVPRAAGNVAVFCQSEIEYTEFQKIAENLVLPSDNPDQKYFQLRDPIIIPSNDLAPQTTLSWLYIRKPAKDAPESGDVDFILDQSDYDTLKVKVQNGTVKNSSIYDRENWDMIEFKNEEYDGLPYITTLAMAEKVRVKF